MEIKFLSDINNIKKSLYIVEEMLSDLKNSGMYFYFPSDNYTSISAEKNHVIEGLINKEIQEIKIDKIKKDLQAFWGKNSTQIIQGIKKLNINSNFKFNCVLTIYGPYGFFHTPNTVYINIRKGTTNFIFETILHEILHLLLFDKLRNLDDIEAEKIVDQTFIKCFGKLFPDYYLQ